MSRLGKLNVEDIKRRSTADELELYSYVAISAETTAQEIVSKIKKERLDKGGVILVYGPQNSGKTITACVILDDLGSNGLKIVATQPDVNRPDVPKDRYYSRSGIERKVKSFATKSDLVKLFGKNDVVVVDEIQFVPYEFQAYFLKEAMHFVDRGGWLVAIGCLYTSQRGEFLLSALLKERAAKYYELTSTCQKCGNKGARLNQRLINGKPTSVDDPELVKPSKTVSYEPRCDECHVMFG